MYQVHDIHDTIVAISTPVGQGGIGIIRLSGREAVAIADKMFEAKSKKSLASQKSHSAYYGWIKDQEGMVVDEVLVLIMRAPKSYTCEDVVEISCHSGSVSLKKILSLAMDLGARHAEPGEFTKRAFLNGRIDLAQAEAVLDIIHAKTNAFLQVSTNQLKGDLSSTLESIREQLMSVYVEIEAIVNFPEDDINAKGRQKLAADIASAVKRVDELLKTGEHGRILKEGIRIVLCGRPNAGKSSLLNVLLKTQRAIVSEIAGTTRDTIEETAQIQGVAFQLIDTAGILEPRDLIEQEAVKRSHMHVDSADLVLLVIDGASPLHDEDKKLIEKVKTYNVLVVKNKLDLEQKILDRQIHDILPGKNVVAVSAVQRLGIDKLEAAIVESIWHSKTLDTHAVTVSNVRHIQSLKNCRNVLDNAQKMVVEGHSLEFVSEEIKTGVNYLDAITGKNIDEDLLNTIFAQFCIGK